LAGLLAAAPASAQQPEVQVDPDSPAGSEYAIPLEQARRQAAPDNEKPQKRGGDSGQLFGAGIEKAPPEAPPTPPPEPSPAPEEAPAPTVQSEAPEPKPDRPKKERSKEKQRDSSPASAATNADRRESSTPQKTAAAVDTASDDGSTGLTMGGIALGVLGVGLLTGFGLRRLFRSA
jgi:outer membrane biosynthesis protein TonB